MTTTHLGAFPAGFLFGGAAPANQLALPHRLTRRRLARQHELGELQGRLIGQSGLTLDGPPRRLDVLPAHHQQSIVGDLPQPEVEGQGGLAEVGLDPPHRLDLRLLHHVRGVDARPQLRIEPQPHERSQVTSMLFEKLIERLPIPGADGVQQSLCLRRIGCALDHV